jgi:osmoprotectant transport system substrate-binding protein
MVRKHMRRAVSAAFAVSLGVALLIGSTGCGSARHGVAGVQKTLAATGKPTIVLGTKNFGEEYILGQLYGQALQAKGFHVVFKGSFGSSELANTAIQHGKMNFYPEYTGVIVLDLARERSPKTAAATYAAAKRYEQRHGLTLLAPTPFYDSDTFTMLTKTARKLGVKTIADMRKVKHFSYAGFPECRTRITCLLGLKEVYGLKQVRFVPLGTISVYTLLDRGTVTAGDGFSTDPQQQEPKYTALKDTKHIFGFQNVAPVVSQKLLAGTAGKLLAKTCDAVSSKLTLAAMRAMNRAYVVDKATPKQIAHGFLAANGLLK